MKSDEISICCTGVETVQRIKILSTFVEWFDYYLGEKSYDLNANCMRTTKGLERMQIQKNRFILIVTVRVILAIITKYCKNGGWGGGGGNSLARSMVLIVDGNSEQVSHA